MNRNIFLGSAFILTGIAGGYVGRSCGLEQQVEALCGQYAEKRKITFTLQADDGQKVTPFNLPASFSRQENFKAQEVSPEYLRGKIGFKYEDDQTEHYKEEPDNLCSRILRRGVEYNYSIDSWSPKEVEEKLVIYNYEDTKVFTSSITIIALNGKIDSVYVSDRINGTLVTIKRDYTGKIKFNPAETNESGARKLFDLYSGIFYHFKQESKIDERLAAYSPRLDITQKIPSAEK